MKGFPNRTQCCRNYQPWKEDADESDQDSKNASSRGFNDNIAVADGQSRDQCKVQGISKRQLLQIADRPAVDHYQSKQRQIDGAEMPDDTKEMICETVNH